MVTQLTKQEAERINLSTKMAKLAVDNLGGEETEPLNDSGCRTPRAVQHRIHPPETCPPAPRKRKPVSSDGAHRVNKAEFFDSPELEAFFELNRQVSPKESG